MKRRAGRGLFEVLKYPPPPPPPRQPRHTRKKHTRTQTLRRHGSDVWMIDSAVKQQPPPPPAPTRSPRRPETCWTVLMGKWIKSHPAGAFLRDCLTPSLRGETTRLLPIFTDFLRRFRFHSHSARPETAARHRLVFFGLWKNGFKWEEGCRGRQGNRRTGQDGTGPVAELHGGAAALRMLRRAARSRSCQLVFFLSSNFPLSHSAKHQLISTTAFCGGSGLLRKEGE